MYFRPLDSDVALAQLLSVSFSTLSSLEPSISNNLSYTPDIPLILKTLSEEKGDVKSTILSLYSGCQYFSKAQSFHPKISSHPKCFVDDSFNLFLFSRLKKILFEHSESQVSFDSNLLNSIEKAIFKDAYSSQSIISRIYYLYNIVPLNGASLAIPLNVSNDSYYQCIFSSVQFANSIFQNIFQTIYFLTPKNPVLQIPEADISKLFNDGGISVHFTNETDMTNDLKPTSCLAYLAPECPSEPLSQINLNYYLDHRSDFFITFSNIVKQSSSSDFKKKHTLSLLPNPVGSGDLSSLSIVSSNNQAALNVPQNPSSGLLPYSASSRLNQNKAKTSIVKYNGNKNSDFRYISYYKLFNRSINLGKFPVPEGLDLNITAPISKNFFSFKMFNNRNALPSLLSFVSSKGYQTLQSPIKSVAKLALFYKNLIRVITNNCADIVFTLYSNTMAKINQSPMMRLLLLVKNSNAQAVSLFLSWACAYSVLDIHINKLIQSSLSELPRIL
ncbi:hypothetical protein AYI68_g5665 [Smittium mucronatum]|uniref:Uncharacterized protein n=1 Tax=Smittium mucronatum TaxID=133383 RepID=A0A1R0GTM6_9FUNG|nr:hypothetical protein AYI68_g5665 [Smittium mucronatum]